jgi:voltage-gated sodium channel
MTAFCRKVTESKWFNNFIIYTIVLASLLVGIETYPEAYSRYHYWLILLDRVILWIFVIEAVLKILSFGKQPWRYFLNGWNLFDFLIVAVCFLPATNTRFFAVLRLARILRVLRLITRLPKLQLLVGALLRSIPSMGYVLVLMLILFYTYGSIGSSLFGRNDPVHFGNLHISMLTLFEVLTLEGWVDVMNIQRLGCDRYGYEGMEQLCTNPETYPRAAFFYFASFILLGAMIVINLFIGVITNSMAETHTEQELSEVLLKKKAEKVTVKEELKILERKLDDIKKDLTVIHGMVERD